MTRTHKIVNLIGIGMPFVGLAVAIYFLWGHGVGPIEISFDLRSVDSRIEIGKIPFRQHAQCVRLFGPWGRADGGALGSSGHGMMFS